MARFVVIAAHQLPRSHREPSAVDACDGRALWTSGPSDEPHSREGRAREPVRHLARA
eukprot:CAMPEP_0179316160 /NCGR_PEP_ID=MMETSP0797-20121207/55512_1 /TAXON_ID=47934 /ORGANISM="Dinophysis acuminata, Strain DAEP01" /LENGTH=56 /DNA_ID=CAMNT_0021026863 /DNA_START=104 /DNA_END=270 /DNA_ORIENTATION=+